jgi:hypothetical protein
MPLSENWHEDKQERLQEPTSAVLSTNVWSERVLPPFSRARRQQHWHVRTEGNQLNKSFCRLVGRNALVNAFIFAVDTLSTLLASLFAEEFRHSKV